MPRQAGANRRRQFWQNEIPLFLRANQGPVRGPPGLAVERPRQPSSQSTCDAASALRGRQNPPADQLAIPCSIPCSGNANILFRKEQGISRRLFKSLCDFASVSVKTTPKQAELVKFPVIFPVLSSRRGGGREAPGGVTPAKPCRGKKPHPAPRYARSHPPRLRGG